MKRILLHIILSASLALSASPLHAQSAPLSGAASDIQGALDLIGAEKLGTEAAKKAAEKAAADALAKQAAKAGASLIAGQAAGTSGVAAAGFFETIANQLESLLQLETTYQEIVEGNDVLRQVYNVSQLITSAPELRDLYYELTEYNALTQALASNLRYYSSSGEVSVSQVYATARLLALNEKAVLEDYDFLRKTILRPGLTMEARLSMIGGILKRIREHKGQLEAAFANLFSKAKQSSVEGGVAVANEVYTSFFLGQPEALWLEERAEKQAEDDLRGAEQYEQERKKYTIENISAKRGDIVRQAFNLTIAIVGFIAMFLLAMAYARRNRGERQANDAFYKWGVGLIFFLVALEIVKIIIV